MVFEMPPFPISLQISSNNTVPVVSQTRQKLKYPLDIIFRFPIILLRFLLAFEINAN